MKKSARVLWLAVLLPLSALAAEFPFADLSGAEDVEELASAMPICREATAANGDTVYCDDGRICHSDAGVRHGTRAECGNDATSPQTHDQEQ